MQLKPVLANCTSDSPVDLKPGGSAKFLLGESRQTWSSVPATLAKMHYWPYVDFDMSTLVTESTGNQKVARDRALLMYEHSNMQPTGRFVRTGDKITVEVACLTSPKNAAGLKMCIVLFGEYQKYNPGTNYTYIEHDLNAGTNEITSTADGFVHIVDEAEEGIRNALVYVSGGKPVPTYIQSDPSAELNFRLLFELFQETDFCLLIGGRVFAEVQRPLVQEFLIDPFPRVEIASRLRFWNLTYDLTDQFWGLSVANLGIAHKGSQRLAIVNPDTGGGYASAGPHRITFQVESSAMSWLLRNQDDWALWHECGHTYQPFWGTWKDLSETTVNVSVLFIQEHLDGESRLDEPKRLEKFEEYFARPIDQRNYDTADEEDVKLLMFDQLRRAFGNQFYARLANSIRVNQLLENRSFEDSAAIADYFALKAAQAAHRNLGDFFNEWGLPITSLTRSKMATLPPLRVDIWKNRYRPTDEIEYEVSWNPPRGAVVVNGTVRYDQRKVDDNMPVDITLEGDAKADKTRISALKVGSKTGNVAVSLLSPDGSTNAITAPIDVRYGTSVFAQGLGDSVVVTIALMPDGTLHAWGVPYMVHPYYETEKYFGAMVLGRDGVTKKAITIFGTDFGTKFASGFDGTTISSGEYLVVIHAEAAGRLRCWSEDEAIEPSAEIRQTFRLEDMRLVPVDLSNLPGAARTAIDSQLSTASPNRQLPLA